MRCLAFAVPFALAAAPSVAMELPWYFETGEREGTFLASRLGPEAIVSATGVTAAPGVPRVQFVGTDSQASVEGLGAACGTTSDLRPADPARWRRGIAQHAGARVTEAWPGIDIVHHGRSGHLEHDFIVAPGADASLVRVRLEGARSITLREEGSLVASGEAGSLVLAPPLAFQEIAGRRVPVDCEYRVKDDEVAFALGAWDRSAPLVIDPVLEWSTYVGGPGNSHVIDIAALPDESIVALIQTRTIDTTPGTLMSADDPAAGPKMLARLAADGSGLLWATYVPGGEQLALRPDGTIVVARSTSDQSLPVVGGIADSGGIGGPRSGVDAWIAIVSADGADIVASTYLGTSDADNLADIAIAAGGDVLVGWTTNPVTPFAEDAVMVRLASDLSTMRWSQVVRGSRQDFVSRIASHVATDDVIVAGSTNSADFPIANAFMADPPVPAPSCVHERWTTPWLARLDGATGSILWSTYFGGDCDDRVSSVISDVAGDVIVGGYTNSHGFPIAAPVQAARAGGDDWFVSRFDASGDLIASTYLGASGTDALMSLALDCGSRVLACGAGVDFPTVAAWGLPAEPPLGVGALYHAAVARFDIGGGLSFSTAVGAVVPYRSTRLGCRCNAVTSAGSSILMGGVTDRIDFPTTPGAWHETYPGTMNEILTEQGTLTRIGSTTFPCWDSDADTVEPLVVRRSRDQQVILGWDETSGGEVGSRFGLYVGTLSSLRTHARWDHVPLTPCVWPSPPATIDAPDGNVYFLVTTLKTQEESSFGRDSFGRERPPSRTPCE